jgi:hypothetical protein
MSAVVFVAVLALSCGREAPDRTNAIQVPLFLSILGIPVASSMLRRAKRHVRRLLFACQAIVYLLYESGISMQTNIRIDFFLILPALALGLSLAFGPLSRSTRHGNQS